MKPSTLSADVLRPRDALFGAACLFALLFFSTGGTIRAEGPGIPEAKPLWADGAPGAQGSDESDVPTIRHYAPEGERNGAAVVICPGGGYGVLAYDHEGHQVAKFLARHGVTAFVLRYRHSPKYRHPIPLQDAQRAIRHVRQHARTYQIDAQRVGVMGFSAGGHLASTVSTHFDRGFADSDDPVDRQSCRPDFSILCYPVISMTADWGHKGSRRNLLGDRSDDEELAKSLSNDLQVTEDTPRAFLFHTAKDTGVPVQNSLAYFGALQSKGVPAELHVYQHGPHGVGLGSRDPVLSTWPKRMVQWLRASNLLSPAQRAAVSGSISIGGEPVQFGAVSIQPTGEDGKWRPSGWAMVRRGKFSIPADVGPGIGECQVTVIDWGDVVPRPTRDDAGVWSTNLRVKIADKNNDLKLDLTP